MSTTTATDKSTIIRRLKANVKEMVHLRRKADVLESSIYVDTHLWVTAAIADGTAKDLEHASQILADTLKTHRPRTIRQWDLNGKFMEEKNLQADKADRRAVNDVVHYKGRIYKSTMLKVVDMLKKGRPYREIKSQIRNAEPSVDISRKAAQRLHDLKRKKSAVLSDEQRLQIEMRVVEGLAKAVYGKVVYITLEDKDGNVLATSDRKRAMPAEDRRRKNEECRERRLANETPEEREARLKKEQQRDRNRRKNWTPAQKEARYKRDKESQKRRRANETPEEREMRLKKVRDYRAKRKQA
jgi:hypothetical protein